MKKIFILVGSLTFFQYFAKAQTQDSTGYQKQKLNKTELEFVYNHYFQDGNNSAVTGGIGTEQLIVYSPALTLKKDYYHKKLTLHLGADIVSSASTDNIDFVRSSASSVDTRFYVDGTYEKTFDKRNLSLSGTLGISGESDYLSLSYKFGLTKTDKQQLRTFNLQVQFFDDDLRYGRFNPDYFRPVSLIYPVELRGKEWFSQYKRYSYNLKMGLTQILNMRNTLGIFPEISYQKGLLSTPFHRMYFSDGTLAVENLPNERLKGALAIKLNSFVGDKIVLKNNIEGYKDNFGIKSFALENETAIKINQTFTVMPNIRFYSQTASNYFAAYKIHKSEEQFYTSDYDLSQFQTYSLGVGVRYSPLEFINKTNKFNTMIFRYNFTYRSNNLTAHTFSMIFQTEFRKK